MAAKVSIHSHSVVATLFRMFIALWIDNNCLIERLCNVISMTMVTCGGKLTYILEMQTRVVSILFCMSLQLFLIEKYTDMVGTLILVLKRLQANLKTAKN